MIRGAVNARHEAVVRLRLRGPGGIEAEVDAIVDSGFTSSLTLPATKATALGLVRQSGSSAVLADGSDNSTSVPRKSSGAVFGVPFWSQLSGKNRSSECVCWQITG